MSRSRSALTRREFLPLITGGVLGLPWLGRRVLAARRPNLILILADDLGYGELGMQGSQDIATPAIDTVAKDGVRFTDGHVSCPLCAPTRAGLMTGRYQQRFGFEHNPGPGGKADATFGLPEEEKTVAERLKAAGYATGLVGKWHLGFAPGRRPTERGFDEFFGFLGGGHPYLPTAARRALLRGTEPVTEKEHLTDAFAREAVAFIERHRRDPFFLYFAPNAVHAPLEAPERYRERFAAIKDPKRRTFAGMLTALDEAVGGVLTALKKADLESETLVVFLSDNGGPTPQTTSGNGPLRGFKAQVYEGGIRIPFCLRWPGRVAAGGVYREPVISLDVTPTLLAAAGVSAGPDAHLDGVDLLPYLTGRTKTPPHETLFWRMGAQHAVRWGNLKLVLAPRRATPELFDLASDIGESHDLAPQRGDDVKRLQAAYDTWDAELMPPRWQGGGRRQRRQRPTARGKARRPGRRGRRARGQDGE